MSSAKALFEQRKIALKKLEELFERPDRVIVIHYSCERFDNHNDGTSPRITVIGVRNLESAVTESFSIHQEAERHGFSLEKVGEHFDTLEKQMLDAFYGFVGRHENYKWLHWNMNRSTYGFEALAHRYQIHGGEPHPIPEGQRFDLSLMLYEIYGRDYVENRKMENVLNLNPITKQDFITGEEEPGVFQKREFVRLQRSVERKLDVIADIATLTLAKKLQVSKKWRKPYWGDPRVWPDLLMDSTIYKWIGLIVLISAFLSLVAWILNLFW